MLERPKFKDCFHVELLESDHVFLLREDSYKVLSGAKYKQLAALLDGTRTAVDLTLALGGQISLPAIQYMVNQLEAQGCLTEGNENGDNYSPQSAFLYALGANAHQVQARLAQTSVTISTPGDADATPLRDALEGEGLQIVEADGQLHIVVVDDYLRADLDTINREAVAHARPWMLVKLAGTKSWIGPIFRPGETACWECMAQRIRINRQVEAFLGRRSGSNQPIIPPQAALPTTLATAAGLVATEVVKWIAQGRNERLENKILIFDHLKMALEVHTVVHRPQCPVCGDASYESTPRPMTYTEDDTKPLRSGLRVHPSEEVFERYRYHISSITGAVTGLSDASWDADGLVYNFIAGHYFPMISDNIFWLRQNLQSHTGGKGTTKMQAKVSAVGEALERFSTCYWGGEAHERGTYEALRDRAIHLHEVLGFSEHQYAIREQWNRDNASSYQVLPYRFREDVEIAWTPIWSLTNEEFKLVPATLCYYGHPDTRYFFNTIDSNGVAAGSTAAEAIIQGFGELVERDSVAIWWYNRITRPGVDLDSFAMPYLDDLQRFYHKINREYWVLDITSDLGIPAFAAVSRRTDAEVEDIVYGFGAHFDPQSAIMQAVTEMNQCLPAVSTRNPDGSTLYHWPQQDAHVWWREGTVANQPYLLPDATVPLKQLSDYSNMAKETLKENVELCVEITRKAGLEMFILDLTRPDIGMSVCRVAVPGMRHFWRRLGPGRLYDVPVALGWLEQPRTEEEMNPYSIFF